MRAIRIRTNRDSFGRIYRLERICGNLMIKLYTEVASRVDDIFIYYTEKKWHICPDGWRVRPYLKFVESIWKPMRSANFKQLKITDDLVYDINTDSITYPFSADPVHRLADSVYVMFQWTIGFAI